MGNKSFLSKKTDDEVVKTKESDPDAKVAEEQGKKSESRRESKTVINSKNDVEFSEELSADTVDIVFCLDVTGSMSSYITRSKAVIKNMIDYFERVSPNKSFFGIVAYRDHPPQETSFITQVHNLSTAEKALSYLNNLQASGGGDTPEAVLQGLMDSVKKINWRTTPIKEGDKELSYQRILIHVGDAPAHGNEFHGPEVDDHWPKGCPSKITIKALAQAINDHNIFYQFCRLTTQTDKMMNVFEKHFNRYEMIDLVLTQENLHQNLSEFEDYKAMNAEYVNRSWSSMAYSEQQEVMFEHKVTDRKSVV